MVVAENDDETREEFYPNNKANIENQRNNTKICGCCQHLPHDIFPGIEHYLQKRNSAPVCYRQMITE